MHTFGPPVCCSLVAAFCFFNSHLPIVSIIYFWSLVVSSMRIFLGPMTSSLPSLNKKPTCIVDTTHTTRVFCGEAGVDIEDVVPENHGPPLCSPLTGTVANHLIHCVHTSFFCCSSGLPLVSSSDCCHPLLVHHAWCSGGHSAHSSPWSCCH